MSNLSSMDLNVGAQTAETSSQLDAVACEEGPDVEIEPYVGMEFESEEAAKEFYDEYARHKGFIMRIDQCHRSEVDKRILSRRLSCNKQGFYVKARDEFGTVRKPRNSTREGCEAMMFVKVNKSRKWVVTRFVKDHTHPLIVSSRSLRNDTDLKDRRIQHLTLELQRQDRLINLYKGLLHTILENAEEQTNLLSTKIEAAASSVRDFETEIKKP